MEKSDLQTVKQREENLKDFIADLFRFVDIAKKCEERFYPLIQARDEEGTKANNAIHEEASKMIKTILSILPTYGIGYKQIISLLNADAAIAKEIERNKDEELVLDELIVKYHLADEHYHALTNAINNTMSTADSMKLNIEKKTKGEIK